MTKNTRRAISLQLVKKHFPEIELTKIKKSQFMKLRSRALTMERLIIKDKKKKAGMINFRH